jgi:FKBP-type peptidyl-prolyl cis-trans isomerase (trigger factor)
MKVDVKKIDQNKRELSIEVDGDSVTKKFEEAYERIAKDAKIPGFRPGKAPRDILEKHYSSIAHEEVLKGLIPQVYDQAVDSQKLDVVDLPQISEVKLDKSTLSFKATVEIKPEIKIKDYKGIKINYQNIEVGPEQIKARLDSIKESRKIENIDDALAKSLGYYAVPDLEKALEAQIYLQKENEQRIKIEQEIIKHITGESDFNLPVSLVERQLKDMISHAKVELALRGVSEEEIRKQEDKLNTQLKPEAEERVKIYLILEAIAKKENIALDDHMPSKVMEFLFREADWQKTS